jgi:serine/threonine-protein kinase
MVELERGTVVAGKYRLDRPLGEGGMGIVWAATHTVTGKSCALKFLKDKDGPSGRERFLREARAACAIRHPNVAPVHDVLEAEGRPLLVMDLLDGEPLSRWLVRSKALSLEETARVMVPVIDAVLAVHAQGIVHRDLKPDNVFITRTTNGALDVKVLDFGIAKFNTAIDSGATPALTATGTMMGTPYYMAPEQIFGDKDIDARADVWALGIMIYECLAGVRPTEGDGVGQVLKVITTDGIVPLDKLAPGIPRELADLVSQMLSRSKDERPALYRVRDALAQHLPASNAPPPVPHKIVSDVDAHPTAPTGVEAVPARDLESDRWPASSRGSSSKRLLWTAIMVGCSGLAVFGFFILKRNAQPAASSVVNIAPTAASIPDVPREGPPTTDPIQPGATATATATASAVANDTHDTPDSGVLTTTRPPASGANGVQQTKAPPHVNAPKMKAAQ